MSGLIDTIVRRRRASASSRLGPPAHPLEEHPWVEGEPADGSAAENGHVPAGDPEPERDEEQPTEVFSAVEPEHELERDPKPHREEPQRPAHPEPDPDLDYPSLRERTRLRRRLRYLTSVREVQLRDLGGFLLELHRFGRERPDLVQAKLSAAAATDTELRSLHHRLDEEAPIAELRRPGIGGACEQCGAVHGSLDRFCASCGQPLQR